MTETRATEYLLADLGLTREQVLVDYELGWTSRHASLIGRKEVLTGKAKFGIFGDGKELPQLALARAMEPGDFRSGYYRDQTLLFALGQLSLEQFFAQLYADADPEREPCSAGRQMNAHFATRLRDEQGRWLPATARPQSAADLSPTASQMPKLVGLAWASKLYRELSELAGRIEFSRGGREVAFGTIGNASCAEGLFWETVNAIGVLRVPAVISIWDDEYGISVPNAYQIAKGHLSLLLAGFAWHPERGGFEVVTVAGWNYPELMLTYRRVTELARREHRPALVHVVELTQPQGHSTSGSHERYKSAERLAWEAEWDGLVQMRLWLLAEGLASAEELEALERRAAARARSAQVAAWEASQAPILREREALKEVARPLLQAQPELRSVLDPLDRYSPLYRRNLSAAAHELLLRTENPRASAVEPLRNWLRAYRSEQRERYGSHLVAKQTASALSVAAVPPVYAPDAPILSGFEVLNRAFDRLLSDYPELIAFGEDVGRLGDVNQGFQGLQARYGELRVGDTGIREATILGQAIGLALRGLRPMAEIQYLDYLLYALQLLSDDLATLRYRTRGAQAAPVIIRTRGHRLEGIWHSGSPMGGILNLVRGVWVCVPRDMTRAAGMYRTLLEADDPAIVVEVLNGYRHKERLPSNLDSLRVPLGNPECLRSGRDVTVVTYGACCRIALEAAELLASRGIECEIWDVQTLLPFDLENRIASSLERTSRLIIMDEDVPGGASAFLFQQLLERQGGFWKLDALPVTLTGAEHRPAYGSDGDYFSKPSRDDLIRVTYELLHEADPRRFPSPF